MSCDRAGALYRGRTVNVNRHKEALAADTDPNRERGGLRDVSRGADVLIGLSAPGLVTRADVATMASDAIVFALVNPVPEVQPEEIAGLARVVATGRSDYPNQVNNSLAFPGIFRGALRVRASDIDEAMKLAAEAIAASSTTPTSARRTSSRACSTGAWRRRSPGPSDEPREPPGWPGTDDAGFLAAAGADDGPGQLQPQHGDDEQAGREERSFPLLQPGQPRG